MHCPYCRHTDTRVLDSRVAEDGGAIRRRRTCSSCAKRFSTVEQMQQRAAQLQSLLESMTPEQRRARSGLLGRQMTLR